jgi:hypothetical protein
VNPDYDALWDASRERGPFANGTEGYGWMAANCGTCIHDKPARNGDEGNGCPLILLPGRIQVMPLWDRKATS